MGDETAALNAFAELDRRLVAAVKGIKLLGAVSWPAAVQTQFLDGWSRGDAKLPLVTYTKHDYSAVREELQNIFLAAGEEHPVGDYLRRVAQSWIYATELLDAAGTMEITEHSVRLFGRPGDRHLLSDAVVGDVLNEASGLNVVLERLVEHRETELPGIAEVMFD